MRVCNCCEIYSLQTGLSDLPHHVTTSATSLPNSHFTVAGAPCKSAPGSGSVYRNQAIIGSDTWEILPRKSLVNTGRLVRTNLVMAGPDYFGMGDKPPESLIKFPQRRIWTR